MWRVILAAALLLGAPAHHATPRTCLTYTDVLSASGEPTGERGTLGQYHRPVGVGALDWATTQAFTPPCANPADPDQ